MACYHPLSGWYANRVNESGKRGIVFSASEGFKDKPVLLPCGTCIGCQLERARQWAMRALHESKLHDSNCFVTVTYEDGSLPANGSLSVRHHQLFLKRLRKSVDVPFRFMMCGEYGERTERPHYHYLLFGWSPNDGKLYSSARDTRIYTSGFLDSVWGFGSCKVGAVTFESAGYVARYTMKKISGDKLSQFYKGREPEFFLMSRRPGIGREWAVRFYQDWYRGDYSILNGHKVKPPKFYDSVVEKLSPEVLRKVKAERKYARTQDEIDREYSRGYVREEVKAAAISTLVRKEL